MAQYDSAQEYFDEISHQITQEQAKSLEGVFTFNIEGAGVWNMEFTGEGGVRDLGSNAEVEPDCTILAKEKDWLDIVSGNTKPMSAFITGKLTVEGSTGKAMKLQQILGS